MQGSLLSLIRPPHFTYKVKKSDHPVQASIFSFIHRITLTHEGWSNLPYLLSYPVSTLGSSQVACSYTQNNKTQKFHTSSFPLDMTSDSKKVLPFILNYHVQPSHEKILQQIPYFRRWGYQHILNWKIIGFSQLSLLLLKLHCSKISWTRSRS